MDSPHLLLLLVKVKGTADSSQESTNILDVAKKSLLRGIKAWVIQFLCENVTVTNVS